MPLVSIITPTYNSSSYILRTYESICEQSHQNWEWLITDDKSNDNTVAIIEDIILKDKRVMLFKNDVNSGAAFSRNISISKASGEFIAFLDSDDLWYPEKLTKHIGFMENHIDFSFTSYEVVDEFDNALNKRIDTKHNILFFSYNEMLRKKATIGCSTVMLRRESFKKIKMPMIRTAQDYALWLSLLKQGYNAFLLNEVLTKYRITPNSLSQNKFKKALAQWHVYRKNESLNLLRTIVNFNFYAFRAIFRS